jgi:hypothetical protein
MSTLPNRQNGVFVTLGLLVVAAMLAAVVVFTSGGASDVELTTARFVPADAAAYIAFNTDLSSSQWVSTFRIIEKLGQKDPEKELKSSAEDPGGLDWEKEVAPFLGGNAAIYAHGASLSSASFVGAVILRCSDAKAALKVFLEKSGGTFEETRYGGVVYYRDTDMSLYAVRIDDHLVIAMDEISLKEALDVRAGNKPSIESISEFKNLRDELTGDFLAFVYVNAGEFLGDTLFSDPVVKKAFDDAGASDLALKPFAAVIGAKGNAFQFQEASVGKIDAISPMIQPRTSRFAKLVPAETAIFFSTQQVAQTWNAVLKTAGKQIDDAIAEDGQYRNLHDALQAAGREMGLSSAQDLIDLFTGETAVAVWFPKANSEAPEFVVLAEVKDEAHAREALASVATASARNSQKPRTETVGGVQVTLFTDADGTVSAYAVRDGYMLIGSEAGLKKTLAGGSANLADSASYAATTKQMPGSLGTYAYLDMASLLRLTGADGILPQLDDSEQALQGLILNYVQERGVVRFSGVLSVKE